MNVKWKVKWEAEIPHGHDDGVGFWVIYDSYGGVDSMYTDWQAAVDWAGSPLKRLAYENQSGA
jgi:hypothetical protein